MARKSRPAARNTRPTVRRAVRGSNQGEVAEIQQLLRQLEGRLEQLTSTAATEARTASSAIPDIITEALTALAERFRDTIHDKARDVGEEAARVGTDAWKKIEKDIGARPLVVLAVAAGIGFLVGLFGRKA